MILDYLIPGYKYKLVRQPNRKDCGPASLLSILKYFGGDASFPYMRESCFTGSAGSSMLDLVEAANKIGFDVRGASGEYEDLYKENMPCIAHVVVENSLNHFLVVYKIRKDKIFLADPGKGKYWISKEKFLLMWKSKAVILISPGKDLLNQNVPSWFDWLFSYIMQQRSWVYQVLFLGFVYTFIGLITALFIQLLIDDFIPGKDYSKIFYTSVFLIVIFLIRAAAGFFRQRFMVILNRKINIHINSDFLAHLFKLPKKFFSGNKTGDITARLHDALRIQNAIIQIAGVSIIDIFLVSGSVILMFYFSKTMALISLIFMFFYLVFLLLSTRKLKEQQRDVMKGYASVESTYIDSLRGVDEIISFNSGNSYSLLNQYFFRNYQDKIKTLGFTQASLSFFAEILNSILVIGLLTVGAVWVVDGSLMIGEMMASYSLLANIVPAVNRFVGANITLQETSIASSRLMDILQIDADNSSGTIPFEMNNNIRIENGEFSWNRRSCLLKNLNITIERGKITTLCGPSGSGKSTLVQIFQRKYNLQQGKFLVDNSNVYDCDLFDFRKNVGVVPQSIKIFNGTIAENILLGREISDLNLLKGRIIELGLFKFYERYEYGLMTLLGEEGIELSGGEKQVISLTRALLDNPEILIIDEGLSGMDIDLEKLILSTIKKYSRNHAVLLITHQINSILQSDYVYVLNGGCISEQGEPEDLVNQNGYLRHHLDQKRDIFRSVSIL